MSDGKMSIDAIIAAANIEPHPVELVISDELVERAARRMCRARNLDPDEPCHLSESMRRLNSDLGLPQWRNYETQARDGLIAAATLIEKTKGLS